MNRLGMTRNKDSTFIPMYSVTTDRALLSQKYVPIATGSERDGIDSEEAIAVAFVSEFQTFKKINQEIWRQQRSEERSGSGTVTYRLDMFFEKWLVCNFN